MNKLKKRLAALEEIQNPMNVEVLFASDEEELREAHATMERVISIINENRRKVENQQTVADLAGAIEDWKVSVTIIQGK